MKRIDEINDDEIRILGKKSSSVSRDNAVPGQDKKHKTQVLAASVIVASLAFIFAILLNRMSRRAEEPHPDFYDTAADVEETVRTGETPQWIGDYSDTVNAYTEVLSRTVNDIPLEIYIPHNCTPSLELGNPDVKDTSIIFTAQAADIRADNGKINGAFVLEGTPLAWGISKKGFVGIIGGKITVGVADNSRLFEQATETDGYFFRQYPLVDNGMIVENKPKGKSIRKSICERAGEIFMVFTESRESFHDFSQALVDLGVDNAVYLVGGDVSFGFYRDSRNEQHLFAGQQACRTKYVNFIVWRSGS